MYNENMNCQYLGNEIKYDSKICYVGVIYDADYDYCIEICINRQNLQSNYFETMKT